MRPPKLIDLPLDFLQMRTADWKLIAVFQYGNTIADLHNLDDIDDIPSVSKDKFWRIQFIKHLLQALSDF